MSCSGCKSSLCGISSCPEICEDLCIEIDLQTYKTSQEVTLFQDTGSICVPVGSPVMVDRYYYEYDIRVKNCTQHMVNNFMPRLDFTPSFILTSTGYPIASSCSQDVKQSLTPCFVLTDLFASLGVANISDPSAVGDFNGGLGGPVGLCSDPVTLVNGGVKNLIVAPVALPPGETLFLIKGYIDVEVNEQILLLPSIFSFIGDIKCCDNTCLPIKKAAFSPVC